MVCRWCIAMKRFGQRKRLWLNCLMWVFPAISKHLKNIFESGEIDEKVVVSKMEITAVDGKRYHPIFYSLDAIISVGYRVNSIRATRFRRWCTNMLRQFAIRGYVIDKKRMENGAFLGED